MSVELVLYLLALLPPCSKFSLPSPSYYILERLFHSKGMRASGCLAIREGTSVNLHQEKVSLEKAALKDIIRRRWETELGTGRQQSKEVKDQLDTHISNVKGILNNYDYEIFCMPNVIANTKTMSRNDTKDYLKHIEALAVGYSSVFGNNP